MIEWISIKCIFKRIMMYVTALPGWSDRSFNCLSIPSPLLLIMMSTPIQWTIQLIVHYSSGMMYQRPWLPFISLFSAQMPILIRALTLLIYWKYNHLRKCIDNELCSYIVVLISWKLLSHPLLLQVSTIPFLYSLMISICLLFLMICRYHNLVHQLSQNYILQFLYQDPLRILLLLLSNWIREWTEFLLCL